MVSVKLRKVGIIGLGHVGAHVAFSLVTQGIVDELVLVDTNKQKVISERQDLIDSMSYLPHTINVINGEYEDLHDCDIVVNSAGKIPETHNRLDEVKLSASIVDSFIDRLMSSGFNGIIINITNPCDIIARHIWKKSGLPKEKVFGTGTGLDSCRFKSVLARETGVDPKSIAAYTLGEHGDSQIAAWSNVFFGAKSLEQLEKENPDKYGHLDKPALLEEVKKAGWVTYEGKHATEFGIASTLARLVFAIYHDEKIVLPASTLLEGQYGEEGVFASTPCVIGKDGIEEVYELKLSEEELKGFKHSCDVIRKTISLIE